MRNQIEKEFISDKKAQALMSTFDAFKIAGANLHKLRSEKEKFFVQSIAKNFQNLSYKQHKWLFDIAKRFNK